MSDDISNEDLLAAADVVVKAGRASTPVLREGLGVGYERAKLLLDGLEEHHIIGPSDGIRARDVIVPDWDTWKTVREFYFDADEATRAGIRAQAAEDAQARHDNAAKEDDDYDLSDDIVSVDVVPGTSGPQRVLVTVHAGQLARVMLEAAKFTDLSEDSEPRCWLELSVSGGCLHAMAFNGVAAGWSRVPLEHGAQYGQASAMIHADDAKALARVVKHRGKANDFDVATLVFDADEHTLYVERVEVEDQRDVRMTLTDYRGTTLSDDAGDPMGWMRVDEFAARFEPDDQPIGALRVHPEVLALFAGLMDGWGDGARFTFGRQRSAHSGRPVLVRILDSFTGYILSLDPNLEGDSKPDSNYRPFNAVDPAERGYVRPAAEA